MGPAACDCMEPIDVYMLCMNLFGFTLLHMNDDVFSTDVIENVAFHLQYLWIFYRVTALYSEILFSIRIYISMIVPCFNHILAV